MYGSRVCEIGWKFLAVCELDFHDIGGFVVKGEVSMSMHTWSLPTFCSALYGSAVANHVARRCSGAWQPRNCPSLNLLSSHNYMTCVWVTDTFHSNSTHADLPNLLPSTAWVPWCASRASAWPYQVAPLNFIYSNQILSISAPRPPTQHLAQVLDYGPSSQQVLDWILERGEKEGWLVTP